MQTITHETFDGLAFPVARVRYSHNGKWNARIFRDSERTYRARVSYDHAVGGGARGARAAALAAFNKALADGEVGLSAEGDYVAIPGDMDAGTYVFTFVPERFFTRHEEKRSTARTANGRDLERFERESGR